MTALLTLADASSTQAMIVAIALLACIAVIMVVAMLRYPVADVIKIWSVLGALTGVVTGSIGSYFFTKPQVDAAHQQVDVAHEQVATAVQKSQRISDLTQEIGLQNLANLPTTQTSTFLRSVNLDRAATQPAQWKSKVLLLHSLTKDLSELKTK